MSKKIYILELIGDPESSGGSVTFSIEGVSTDRETLERLKVEKDKWLDEYLGDEGGDEDDDRTYTLYNTDLSSRPHWTITEHDLI